MELTKSASMPVRVAYSVHTESKATYPTVAAITGKAVAV